MPDSMKILIQDANKASRIANRNPTPENLASASQENDNVFHVRMAEVLRTNDKKLIFSVEKNDPYGKRMRMYRSKYFRAIGQKDSEPRGLYQFLYM